MRKGLFAAALLAGVLTFSAMVGCTSKKATYEVAITNKEEMQAEWLSDAESRTLGLTIKKNGEEQNATKALQAGELKLVSSAEAVAKVVGRAVAPVAGGKATITVTYGNASDSVEVNITQADPHGKSAQDPLNVAEAIAICKETGETQTTIPYYIKGYVSKIGGAYDPNYDNMTIYIADTKTDTTNTIDCYRVKPATGVDATKISLETEVLVSGFLVNYNGNTPELAAGGTIHSATGGKQAQTFTVTTAEALAAAMELGDNESSIDTYIITGYVVNVVSAGTFYMHDEKGARSASKDLFEVYNWTGDNKAECTLGAQVRVTATLKHYQSTSNPSNYAYETDKISNVEILAPGAEPEITITGPTALSAIEVDTQYWAGVLQTTINRMVFVDGTISSNKLGTDKLANAANVVFETVSGGYKLKIGTKYANLNNDKKLVLGDTSTTTWIWSSSYKTVYATVSETNYYIGAYSTYATLSASAESYVIVDGAIKAGQFPIQFYAKEALTHPTELQLDEEAKAVAGVNYQLAIRMNPYNADVADVTFTSSDETVATVAAGGVVTPLKAGTTTITAKYTEEIKDTCELTVVEVDLGSLEHPLTVAQALAACETLNLGVGEFAPKLAYITGEVELEADAFYNGNYFGKWNLKNGTDKLYVANSDNNSVVQAYERDVVVASGYLSKDSTKGFELLKKGSDYPKVLSVTTRGTSTVTVGDHEHATVSELSATSGLNNSDVTFKVAPDANYDIVEVSATSVAGKQVLEEAAGVYTLKIKGNTTIAVTAQEHVAGQETVMFDFTTVTDKDDVSTDSSLVERTFNGYVFNTINVYNNGGYYFFASKTAKASATLANKTAIPGAITKIEFTTTSGASGSAVYVAKLATSAVSTAVTEQTNKLTGKGTLTIEADEADAFNYFAISCTTTGYNGQLASIKVTYKTGA